MHSRRFLLECYWLITMNVENILHVRFKDCFPLSSGFQSGDKISLSFVHMFICFCWRIFVVIGLAMQPRVCVMWRLNLGAYLFMPDFISTLCSLDCPSVSLVFFKKFWYPDSRIIILSIYQFSLCSFRDYLVTYKQLCIVAFPLQRNRSKICVFCIFLFQHNLKIFSYSH